jgi:hypothetical protein
MRDVPERESQHRRAEAGKAEYKGSLVEQYYLSDPGLDLLLGGDRVTGADAGY